MTFTTRTYAQIARARHEAGGETQTEATAKISDRVLRKSSVGFLNSILGTLQDEANSATTLGEYGDIREQIVRVRHALNLKGAL